MITDVDRPIPDTTLNADYPVSLIPGPKSPDRPASPTWSLAFGPNNPDAWKAPEEWDRIYEPRTPPIEQLMEETIALVLDDRDPTAALDLSILQQEVKRMAAASPGTILSRLKEVWSRANDPSLNHELDMEKKRWMLSVLHHLDPIPQRNPPRASLAQGSSRQLQKTLALYESKSKPLIFWSCDHVLIV